MIDMLTVIDMLTAPEIEQTIRDLRGTLSVLREMGWNKAGGLKNQYGEVCTFGAWHLNLRQNQGRYSILTPRDGYSPAELRHMLFGQALRVTLDKLGNTNRITAWNDDPETTWEDLELVFKTALHDLEEQLDSL